MNKAFKAAGISCAGAGTAIYRILFSKGYALTGGTFKGIAFDQNTCLAGRRWK